jgi:ABC-type sugar transport system ATPase subunit
MLELSIGTQQLVLIARSIHREAKLLILDEPTAILSINETETLFRAIAALKAQGVSVLYISHRLAEIFQVADRISVLRDGRLVAQHAVGAVSANQLVAAMTGRQVSSDVYRSRPFEKQAPILEVRKLSRAGNYQDVSFDLRTGEVLGIYGLVGAGRSEMARAIYGELMPDSGEMQYAGTAYAPRNCQAAIAHGILYVPEDRPHQGIFAIRAVSDNLTVGVLGKLSAALGWILPQRERSTALALMKDLSVKASSSSAPVSSLSGGNQQKVVLGRGLSHKPKVLILDEPTHGIDVGTKSEIHRLIMELAEGGLALVLISSDLPEVLALADNVLVMHEGSMMDYMSRAEMSETRILRSALGLGDMPTGTQTDAQVAQLIGEEAA